VLPVTPLFDLGVAFGALTQKYDIFELEFLF
jgi:hypothetical protein